MSGAQLTTPASRLSALNAAAESQRLRGLEQRLRDAATPESQPEANRTELYAALDEELMGLPERLLEERAGSVIGIPTLGPVRSLNLANTVAIVLYEALRRLGALAVVDTSRET